MGRGGGDTEVTWRQFVSVAPTESLTTMKSGAKATREAVFAVCNELMMAGKVPTVRDILKATKGSLSTITPLRDEWWKSIVGQFKDGKLISGLPADVSQQLVNVWNLAAGYANDALLSERLALESKSLADAALVLAAQARAERAVEALVDAQAEASRALAAHSEATNLLRERAAEHQGVVAVLTDRIATIDAQSRSIEDAHASELRRIEAAHSAEFERFDSERKRLMIQLDTQRQDITRLSGSNAKHEARADELSARLAEDAARLSSLEDVAVQARSEAAEALRREQGTQSALAALSLERDGLQAQLQAKESLLVTQAEMMTAQTRSSEVVAAAFDELKTLISDSKSSKRSSAAK